MNLRIGLAALTAVFFVVAVGSVRASPPDLSPESGVSQNQISCLSGLIQLPDTEGQTDLCYVASNCDHEETFNKTFNASIVHCPEFMIHHSSNTPQVYGNNISVGLIQQDDDNQQINFFTLPLTYSESLDADETCPANHTQTSAANTLTSDEWPNLKSAFNLAMSTLHIYKVAKKGKHFNYSPHDTFFLTIYLVGGLMHLSEVPWFFAPDVQAGVKCHLMHAAMVTMSALALKKDCCCSNPMINPHSIMLAFSSAALAMGLVW